MKNIKKKKYLIYLLVLGILLSIMGITANIVAGTWSPISLGLLFAGLVIIGCWLLFVGAFASDFWRRRSTQVGTNAIIATLAMLVILGLINFLGVRYGQRIDLTENQLFTLSPMSQQVVKNLQQPVKVWIFSPKPNPLDQELLKNYRRYGSKLEYEFVDPQLKPTLAQKFNLKTPGEVYLEYGAARKLLQSVSDGERLSEIKLTNGIEQLTSDRTDLVYFLQGHGERPLEQVEGGLSEAVTALKDKNFIAQPLNLADRPDVPEDAALIVVAGPKRSLFSGEAQALRNYLSTGGSLLLMVDPEVNPGLDNILADWGVQLDSQIVIDASGQGRSVGLGPATPLVKKYGNHPITRDFGDGFSVYPLARPVATKPVEGVTETPLILTNEQSWGESNPEKQPLQFDPKSDRPGPLAIGVALSRKVQPASALPTPTPQPQTSPAASPSATATPQLKTTPAASPTATPQLKTTPAASPSVTATPQLKTTPAASPSVTVTPQLKTTPAASPTATPQLKGTPAASPSKQPEAVNKEKTSRKTSEARLIVYGNSNFVTDGWFKQQLNGDVFLNSISWLSKRDEQALSIRPKEPKNRRINLTAMQAGSLGWAALVIMPLLSFTTAGIMWWRRR